MNDTDRDWLQPEHFCNEPIYCEALHNPDDIVYTGSDDDAYSSPTERRRRYEAQAHRFLDGKPVFLLSASLRGPFDRKSGWVNPWRSKSKQKKRSAPSSRAVEHATERNAPSGSLEPSSSHLRMLESSQLDSALRYMDSATFSRVRDWRENVLVEEGLPDSPSQSALPAEPASADSRRATQQTTRSTRRQSDWTPLVLDDETNDIEASTLSSANRVRTDIRSVVSSQKESQRPSVLQDISAANRSLKQPAKSQEHPQASSLPAAKEDLPPDMADLSPRAVGTYEQAVMPKQQAHPPSSNQTVPKGTPNGVLPERTASSRLQKTQKSCRSDGSFRYRRKDVMGKGPSLHSSKLAGPPSTPNDGTPQPSLEQCASPKPPPVDNAASGSVAGEEPPRDAAAAHEVLAEAPQEAGHVTPDVEAQEALNPEPEPVLSQLNPELNEAPNRSHQQEDHRAKNDALDTASQMDDGPTLVASESPSSSEHPSMPSFGNFSSEKYSQDVISEYGLPRRLLWPKLRRRASGDDSASFGLDSVRSPTSKPQKPSPASQSPAPSNPPTLSDETAFQVVAELEVVPAMTEDQPSTSTNEAASQVMARSEAVPMTTEDQPLASRSAEGVEGSETAREAESQAIDEMDKLQSGLKTMSAVDDAKPEPQQASLQPPAAQSPWVKSDATLAVPKLSGEGFESPATTGMLGSPLKATQSLWVNGPGVLPDTSAAIAQLPAADVISKRLPLLAAQRLRPAATQSPWAKGDSQMQLPDVRLFNPLSSPANSHVLPTADPATQSQVPGDEEDVDMRDSQLYPQHPSTPETKQSGLPTPDFTLSAKSFKDFMTPSPKPKRRRVSAAVATDHLPSTQALIDAAISNPWTRPPTTTTKPNRKRKQQDDDPDRPSKASKRVSWADLSTDNANANAIDTSTKHASDIAPRSSSSAAFRRSAPRRATSPPPSILSTAQLPTANQKFGRHFAAVAGRRVGTTPLRRVAVQKPKVMQTPGLGAVARWATPGVVGEVGGGGGGGGGAAGGGVRLLPSASQQVCGSPAVEAMAEAFIAADADANVGMERDGGDGEQGEVGREVGMETEMEVDLETGLRAVDLAQEARERTTDEGGDNDAEMGEAKDDIDEEMQQQAEEGPAAEEEGEPPVDDVSAVLENLGDFLTSWDIDSELAKARAETERKKRSRHSSGLSELMDIGVWD